MKMWGQSRPRRTKERNGLQVEKNKISDIRCKAAEKRERDREMETRLKRSITRLWLLLMMLLRYMQVCFEYIYLRGKFPMKMMGQDADGCGRPLIGRPTTTSLAFFPPWFPGFLALRVKMGGRQKYTGKKGNCSFECGCAGLQLPLLLQQQFSILLEPQLLIFTSQRFSTFLYCTLAAVISLVGSTSSIVRIYRSDNTDVTTNLCFHTATATILLSHHTTTFLISHTNSLTPQHLPFSFHTRTTARFSIDLGRTLLRLDRMAVSQGRPMAIRRTWPADQ
jgi:hypothetical protein